MPPPTVGGSVIGVSRVVSPNPYEETDFSDNWWDVGWDWLLQRGPEPRIFNDNAQMTQDLMGDFGVNRARAEFYQNGLSQNKPYHHDFGAIAVVEATLQGNMTAHFLGSYDVTIEQISESELSFQVYNKTSIASGARIPWDRTKTLLEAVPRSQTNWGGNLREYFVWTEPIMNSYTVPKTRFESLIDSFIYSYPGGF